MINVLSEYTDYHFSGTLPDLYFSISEDEVLVDILVNNAYVYSETLVPDADSCVKVRELSSLIDPYIVQSLMGSVKIYLRSGNDDETLSFSVYYAAVDISLSAETFLSGYFLTTLLGEKHTALGCKEYLHFVPLEQETGNVVCAYLADGAISTATTVLDPQLTYKAVNTLDVSPDSYEVEGKTLVSYTVTFGERKQTYQVRTYVLAPSPCLLFDNSFGVQETFYCRGTLSVAPEYERSSAVIGGMFRNFYIEENRVFQANTGYLSPNMAAWAEEVFRSPEIYLLIDSLPDKEVTITECDAERSNAPDSLPAFTFSYRYAQRNHNVLYLERAGRVFDHTFDHTFG